MADSTSAITNTFDIANRYQSTSGTSTDYTINHTKAQEEYDKMYKDKTTLDFTDMLSLMVAQFQNQTMDNQASTTDMMNQLTQMSSMQAMTDMVSQMKELTLANVLSYSSSLVGKTVTLGIYDDKGNLTEKVGEVEGAGTYDGQQVIFVEGKSYLLSSIMAIGKLPPRVDQTENGEPVKPWTDPDEAGDAGETGSKTEGVGETEETPEAEAKG